MQESPEVTQDAVTASSLVSDENEATGEQDKAEKLQDGEKQEVEVEEAAGTNAQEEVSLPAKTEAGGTTNAAGDTTSTRIETASVENTPELGPENDDGKPEALATNQSDQKEEDKVDQESAVSNEETEFSAVTDVPKSESNGSNLKTDNNSNGVPGVGQSKGAKILMNRFSTWRKTANEKLNTQAPVLSENAKQASEYAQRVLKSNSLSSVMPSMNLASRFASQKPKPTPNPVDEKMETALDVEAKSENIIDSKKKEEDAVADGRREAEGEAESTSNLELPKPVSQGSLLDNDEDDHDENNIGNETTQKSEGVAVGSATIITAESRERVRAVFSKASTTMAESVATGFRGRYKRDVSATTKPTESTNADLNDQAKTIQETSQMALILKSRAGEYMQEILDKLEPYEFAMLLGRGMLGVNLKQCYLKNRGIFVDYLVDGGQAAQSGLVCSGDLMVRLGDSDFRKGTIKDIPIKIGQAKRPAVLVLATGTQVALERINFVDVAVAMMHRARKFYIDSGKLSVFPSEKKTTTSVTPVITDNDKETIATPLFEKEEKNDDPDSSETSESICDVTIEANDTVDAYMSPPWPTLAVRKEFIDETFLRSLDNFVVSDLCDVLDIDSNFRSAIRNAFLVCALDSRRLPFLARHFSDEVMQISSKNQGSAEEENNNNMTPSAQLMLFLELSSFLDLYDVTPPTRLKDVASRIAYKFFLPTKIGNGIQPPLFDFHQIVPYSSLRHLEFALNGKSESIPRDLFLDFQKSIVDSLSGAPFLSFLASADCSRMRAYLRDTAPFVNLSFRNMMDAMAKGTETAKDTAAAHNSFSYILLYLICRMEKECSGEYDFGIENEANRRLLGATNDICCALFIKRTLLPTIDSIMKEGDNFSQSSSEKLMSVVEQFWSLYLDESLELSTRNAEIEGIHVKVRNIIQTVSAEFHESSDLLPRTCVSLILKSKLAEEATVLADEIFYDYAANTNSKFRDHKFHEWMCSEFAKALGGDPYWYRTQSVPVLPPGCLKRFLRRVELPNGVSSHKPYQVTPKEELERNYHNADWAVVFGSSVGTELASQMAVPGLDSPDIRRYTCLPVALDCDHTDYDDFRPEQVLPATFESYAFVPPSKPKPFQSVVDAGRVTTDGWEVSLVTFTIPNADSSSSGDATESALYGVSLCLQRISSDGKDLDSIVTKLVSKEGELKEKDETWNSPISFEKESIDGSEKYVRKVRVSSKLPIYERHLQEKTWVERVEEEEYRDQTKPISMGIALVSRRNVIFSMRDSLSRLFFDYSRSPGQSLEVAKASTTCNALVEILGALSYQDHEGSVLRDLLAPYLRVASNPWLERPFDEQEKMFESHALRQLTDCLPPTSLALLFVTALLEQKIIFSSGRRSVLHAASLGLATLLRPLKWSHLLVPMVPGALANDLIQYPAPFILGVPSEDADSMDLLGNLPRDVTLVDLDVGRVILAPDFGQDNEMCRKTADTKATARALRSQVLYLAQGLGEVFGKSLRPDSWVSDEPSLCAMAPGKIRNDEMSITARLDQLRLSAKSFIDEILAGSVSCCYWIEELTPTYGSSVEPTVLFDEDKFFEIKNHRANMAPTPLFNRIPSKTGSLVLVLDDFDLVLESFLRCQSMSIYISSRPKKDMFYF
ncbi:unnamed protein product [Pseudo-nitzschia multistriata]|uniref:UDENN domain-containing protein n=1 Tax=Pseudo-nitzschia multistriata TaxID=183589 RepID=A0A448YW95_9STRA|nr:unnamed protein product [Pseudo-nitzschia multistriata]